MPLTGHSLIAGRTVPGRGAPFRAVDPATGASVEPPFTSLAVDQVGEATRAAAEAAPEYARAAPPFRAGFLDRVAEEIEALGDELPDRAARETGLPAGRLASERGRTCGQLRLLADVVRRGDHLGVRVDPPQPDRLPLPRPDLRVRRVPIGPVAVFGAANFPLAFSTAGGDTAAALAAGCPVVVKAHPAHPGTGELVARAVTRAAEATGMPAGVFSFLVGDDTETGLALVTDPLIRAVAFTGSRRGGLALTEAAAARPRPIPVFAEMSSVNPVLVLDGALDASGDAESLAQGYVASLTGGAGQFCTSPGLVFVPTGARGDRFVEAVGEAVAAASGQTMLTAPIREAFVAGEGRLSQHPGVEPVGRGSDGTGPNAPAPAVHECDLATFTADPSLAQEVFGAAGLVVRWGDVGGLTAALDTLDGQLTATVHAAPEDHDVAAVLVPVLESLCGRIVFNGWPTGVEVTHAMVHGGPFPATSDGGRSTSVGSLALDRFLRPVCYQDVPDAVLPEELRDGNPWRLDRIVDGVREG